MLVDKSAIVKFTIIYYAVYVQLTAMNNVVWGMFIHFYSYRNSLPSSTGKYLNHVLKE